MADNTEQMNLTDLLELLKGGAKIQIDRPPQTIAQFDELVGHIKKLIESNAERNAANLAQSQAQLEVLATLQSLIKQQAGANRSPQIDLKPLETVLSEIQAARQTHEPADYDFKILRNGPGLSPAHTIQARVVRSALN